MISATPYPLAWPIRQPRSIDHRRSKFRVSLNRALDDLAEEIERHIGDEPRNGDTVVVSMNIPLRRDGWPRASTREPADPGVALYLPQHVIACDTYDKVAANVRAIHKTLEALRTIERHGSTGLAEQAWSGFAMLGDGRKPWRAVLGFEADATVEDHALAKRYRDLARTHHPDRSGGNAERMREINEAMRAARKEIGV